MIWNKKYMHEYGHYLQSQSFGFLYLPNFAFPSLVDAMGNGDHKFHPVEQDANARALKYFVGKYGESFANRNNNIGWNNIKNPITGYDWSQGFYSNSNQSAINNSQISFSGWDVLGVALSLGAFYALPVYSFVSLPWYAGIASTVGSYWMGGILLTYPMYMYR
jgi:hypothetical protein